MKIAAIFLAALLSTACAPAAAEKYVYASRAVDDSYFSGKDTLTIDTDLRLFHADHGAQRLEICSDSKTICFQTTSVKFAVKTGDLAVGQKWESNGQQFSVIRRERLSALGANADVYVIRTERPEHRNDYFYYSTENGLLAMKFVDSTPQHEYVRFLLLEDEVGFPFRLGKVSEAGSLPDAP